MIRAPFSRFNIFHQQKSNEKGDQKSAVLKLNISKKPDEKQPNLSESSIENDIIRYLISKEKKFILPVGFMDGTELTTKMRALLIDWLFLIQQKYSFFPETLHLAVCIIDQVLATKSVTKSELQLMGITALYVAHKFEETSFPHVDEFAYYSCNTYTRTQIFEMERRILNQLQFDLTCPSPFVFTRCFLTIIHDVLDADPSFANSDVSSKVYNMSKYFEELALLSAETSSVSKSGIAIAALFMSLLICNVDPDKRETIESRVMKKVGLEREKVDSSVNIVVAAVSGLMKQTKLKAVKSKYNSSKYDFVSKLAEKQIKLIEGMVAENESSMQQ